MNEKLNFSSDYTRGAHPATMQRMVETNMMHTAGYGLDEISESARKSVQLPSWRICSMEIIS